jgi:hypothetical protein
VIGGEDDSSFADEYSVGGWFKFGGVFTKDWHLVFRLTINEKAEN